MPEAPLVLVVEDEPAIQRLVTLILAAELGVHVRTVRTGAEALAFIRTRPPALLVLDLSLPDSGGDMIERVSEAARESNIPVLVCSATARTVHDLAGRVAASAYVVKPFEIDDLIEAASRLLFGHGHDINLSAVR